jgi:putative ABC transport system substrate-binding protein
MRRRHVITRRRLLGMVASVCAAPAVLHAQQTRRLGVVLFSTPNGDANFQSLRHGLADFGYVEGRTLALDIRAAEGQAHRLPALAESLVRSRPDAIFALGGDVTAPVAQATKTIPVVFATSADPVRAGIVASLARQGGNATGITFLSDNLAAKRLEILKEAVPTVQRVAFVWNPNHLDNELGEARETAASLAVDLILWPVNSPSEIDAALSTALEQRVQALYVVSSRLTGINIRRFVDFASRNRMPLIGGWGAWTQNGALLSFGPNLDEMVRRGAGYVDRIFQGAKPADLPVQQPSRFALAVNLKTAKEFGIELPPPLVVRADEVIE